MSATKNRTPVGQVRDYSYARRPRKTVEALSGAAEDASPSVRARAVEPVRRRMRTYFDEATARLRAENEKLRSQADPFADLAAISSVSP